MKFTQMMKQTSLLLCPVEQ